MGRLTHKKDYNIIGIRYIFVSGDRCRKEKQQVYMSYFEVIINILKIT